MELECKMEFECNTGGQIYGVLVDFPAWAKFGSSGYLILQGNPASFMLGSFLLALVQKAWNCVRRMEVIVNKL